MELKRHLDTRFWLVGAYFVALVIYLIVGLHPAGARDYNIVSSLYIPSIALDSDVTSLSLNDNKLDTPDSIVGSFSNAENKTLLIGHSTTVFENLHNIDIGAEIFYNNEVYRVDKIETVLKSNVNMNKILSSTQAKTIKIMTCAGELYGDGDASHRLIITATIKD